MNASIGKVNVTRAFLPFGADGWRTAFWLVWTTLLIAKIVLAAQLAPFGDEAWYWQESRHLALGYSDLPPLTAWMIALGEALFGHGVLAMRAPFLLLGAGLPLLVVRTTTRVFDARAGWCAGLLALGLPLLATLGIFALPDVPLTFAAALALDAFERAARERRWRDWVVLGLALALANLAHYRAAMLLFAGLVFLLATARSRALWRERGLWLALALAIAGALPALAFNLRHHWSAVNFQVMQRNPWSFHADALVQPIEQALVCTPLFYALLLWALWRVALNSVDPRRRADGAPSAPSRVSAAPAERTSPATHGTSAVPWDLFLCCAALPILAYFALGLFADDTRFRAHWPLPGYLPLLMVLPAVLREAKFSRGLRLATFGLLASGSVLAFAYLGMIAVPGAASVLAHAKAFPQQFVGWNEAAAQTRVLLAQPRLRDAILVADNFMLAAELDFALAASRPLYVLDHRLNTKHGRAPQLAIWQRDEAALRALGRRAVLLVVGPDAARERERAAWLQTLCTRVDDLTPLARLQVYDGRKRFRWYAGTVATDARIVASADCVAARP